MCKDTSKSILEQRISLFLSCSDHTKGIVQALALTQILCHEYCYFTYISSEHPILSDCSYTKKTESFSANTLLFAGEETKKMSSLIWWCACVSTVYCNASQSSRMYDAKHWGKMIRTDCLYSFLLNVTFTKYNPISPQKRPCHYC